MSSSLIPFWLKDMPEDFVIVISSNMSIDEWCIAYIDSGIYEEDYDRLCANNVLTTTFDD